MRKLCLITSLIACLCAGTALGFFNGFTLNFGGNSGARYIDLLPSLSWSPTFHSYSSQNTGTETNYSFTLSNTGNDVAEDVAISVTGTSFRLYSTTTFGNLSAGRTRVAKVQFKPLTAATFTGYLNYSAPNIAKTAANLSGKGLSSYVVDDSFDTDTLSNYTQLWPSTPVTYDSANKRVQKSVAGNSAGIYYNTPAGAAAYNVQAIVNAGGFDDRFSGIFFNGDGAGSSSKGIYAYRSGSTTVGVRSFNAGSTAYVSSTSFTGGKTWPADTSHLMKVVVSGTTATIYVDWNDDGDFADADETVLTVNGLAYSGQYAGLHLASTWADSLKIWR